MNLPSKLIEEAVDAFTALPGIGKKTALRLVLHLLNSENENVEKFGAAILDMKRKTRFCSLCQNISETEVCLICANPSRDKSVVCIVESLRELIAIENTGQFKGTYHILGGIISPVDGIGPEELNIGSLVERLKRGEVKELIMALSPTIEGDTTIFYISRTAAPYQVNITTIARGVAFGGELEYVDDLTLSRSLANRLPYDKYLVNK